MKVQPQTLANTIFAFRASLAISFVYIFLKSTVLFSLPATNRIVPKIPNIGLVTAEGGTSFLTEKQKKRTSQFQTAAFMTVLEHY